MVQISVVSPENFLMIHLEREECTRTCAVLDEKFIPAYKKLRFHGQWATLFHTRFLLGSYYRFLEGKVAKFIFVIAFPFYLTLLIFYNTRYIHVSD
jgi:hypothetical protein